MAGVHALADGAGWIWMAVQRVLTGCVQTLDFFHACQHLNQCAARIFGEGASEARAAYEQGRGLLVRRGWAGVCAWVGELLGVADDKERERRRKRRIYSMWLGWRGRFGFARKVTGLSTRRSHSSPTSQSAFGKISLGILHKKVRRWVARFLRN